jgi:hypothetical protein
MTGGRFRVLHHLAMDIRNRLVVRYAGGRPVAYGWVGGAPERCPAFEVILTMVDAGWLGEVERREDWVYYRPTLRMIAIVKAR